MKIKNLLILSLGLFISFSASARKPAVEDFVGVIPESYQETPKGTEVLFDFNKKVQSISHNNPEKIVSTSDLTGLFGLATIISLPLMMWIFITRSSIHPKTVTLSTAKTSTSTDVTSNNITNLDDYRKPDDDGDQKAS